MTKQGLGFSLILLEIIKELTFCAFFTNSKYFPNAKPSVQDCLWPKYG